MVRPLKPIQSTSGYCDYAYTVIFRYFVCIIFFGFILENEFKQKIRGVTAWTPTFDFPGGGGGSDVKIEKNAKCSISVIDRGAKIITPTELIRS